MKALEPTSDALYRIKRGLAGYVSYLAACEMNEAFSEYILYEPTLRLLVCRGFTVKSEVPCPGYPKKASGDLKRLDFVAEGHGVQFALEMKWARTRKLRTAGDLEKLRKFCEANANALGLLCVFGRKSVLESLSPLSDFSERGSAVYAEFGVTKFGCRTFEVANG